MSYAISTGGQAGSFTCSSTEGMAQLLSRYASPYMVGLDFDIEGGQTATQINNLISNAPYAHTLYPNPRFSFTLATQAASDGSHGGLNGSGDAVVRAVKASNLTNDTINLMVMDYGNTSPAVCVVSNGKCDMGQSAIQAAKDLEHTYGIAASNIKLTPTIGLNDAITETFTLSDVDTMVSYATSQHGRPALLVARSRYAVCEQQRLRLTDLQLGQRHHAISNTANDSRRISGSRR